MKIIKQINPYPKHAQAVLDDVQAQAAKDLEEFDKRRANAERETEEPIKGVKYFTGRDAKYNPEDISNKEEKTYMKIQKRGASLTESINPDDAARIIKEVIKNSFNIDVDVDTYKDDKKAMVVIAQFIVSEDDNEKMIYDELKAKLYKRFNNEVNISCKTFSSTNLKEKSVEYKIKVFVLKEKFRKKRYKTPDYDSREYYASKDVSDSDLHSDDLHSDDLHSIQDNLNEDMVMNKDQELENVLQVKLNPAAVSAIKDRHLSFYNDPEQHIDMKDKIISDLKDLEILQEEVSTSKNRTEDKQKVLTAVLPDTYSAYAFTDEDELRKSLEEIADIKVEYLQCHDGQWLVNVTGKYDEIKKFMNNTKAKGSLKDKLVDSKED